MHYTSENKTMMKIFAISQKSVFPLLTTLTFASNLNGVFGSIKSTLTNQNSTKFQAKNQLPVFNI